jgi:transposase
VLETSQAARLEQIRQLMPLRGIGINGAWVLVRAFFGGRDVKNRREVRGVAGFTPTPYHRGASVREQGLTTSGTRHGRWMTTALAWSWGRYQPERALRCWVRERFGGGGKRLRRIGMVAVARQVRMALWRFLTSGVFPAGAVLKEA